MTTHSELVKRAVIWLRSHHKCPLVFAEMTTAAAEIPDTIGWRFGCSKVVECKVSRADFFKELRTKAAAIHANQGMGIQRWYLVPPDLVGPEEIPAWCGLAYAHTRKISIIKEAPDRVQWDARSEAQMLSSAIRRMELGSIFDRKNARWESYRNRVHRQRTEGKAV